MLDFHSHILPGIDDGSDSVETTEALLKMLKSQGVTKVAATPHFYAHKDTPEDFLARRQESLEQVAHIPDAPELLPGAEVAYFDGMSRCQALKNMQIGTTGYLLVEMPFAAWSSRMLKELFGIRTELGLIPVLAHIERYRSQVMKNLPELLDMGMKLQVNCEAFLSLSTRRWAVALAREGLLSFLGTDTHNLTNRAPNYHKAVAVIAKRLGQDCLQSITDPER